MSFSKDYSPMLPFEGLGEAEEVRGLRAQIRDVLREYVDVVRKSADPKELKRVLHTLELGAPSLRMSDEADETELRRINRRRWDEFRSGDAEEEWRRAFFKVLSDEDLIAAHHIYFDAALRGGELRPLPSGRHLPAQLRVGETLDSMLVQGEMQRRGLV